MGFKVGNKIQIKLQVRTFYINTYKLTTYIGIAQRVDRGCLYIKFGDSKVEVVVLSRDLELVKGQQLLFSFMT
ncbi:hypothetical protein LCGC14_0404040 [marine sediment metagenome]|uniref:Uncharacterized protein n=1 Tax=marine sediment metagenome TaxID=412755 RepID=A0A0F9SVX8_9ZZZZ